MYSNEISKINNIQISDKLYITDEITNLVKDSPSSGFFFNISFFEKL